MTSADVTRRELSFGVQDGTTGWFRKLYAETTIKGSIQPQGSVMSLLPCGSYAKYPNTLFTEYVVHEGDQIIDADLDIYELNTVVKWSWLDMFSHRTCEAVKKQFDQRDATSGTWHLDSDALSTDPRSRHKVYLDAYLNPANIVGDYITCFDGADYPIKYLFNADLGVDTDLVISIGKEAATSRLDYLHKTYAFEETVPINLYAVNKTGITAPNLIEQAEQEIRHAVTDNPTTLGSIRSIQSTKHTPMDLGDKNYLWNTTVTIKYTRENDEYVPTLPTITYGATQANTFIFPNVLKITLPNVNNDVFIQMPGRIGDYPQALGAESLEIQLTCDLDMEHTNLTWKRSQIAAKTDYSNFQVFLDIMHNAAVNQTHQHLTLDWGVFDVRLIRMEPAYGGSNIITLTFKEYNATAGDPDYRHRWGIAH
jgi:hypothetical protein